MTRPETLYEAASYELIKFRERRMADRRFNPRATADRRAGPPAPEPALPQELERQADDPKANEE